MPILPDLHHLEVLVRVLEEKSVSRGARTLGLAQPTVSGHLASLERMVGTRLFDRVEGEIRPTRAGRTLARYGQDLLRLRQEALAAVGTLRDVAGGTLDVGGSNIPGTYVLPRVIQAFQSAHPGVRVTLRVGDSTGILGAISDGDCELGIVGARPPKEGFVARVVGHDVLQLVVGREHAWAKRRTVAVADLPGERYLARERGSGSRALVERVLAAEGLPPEAFPPSAELGSNEAVKQAVIAGLGFSFCSAQSVAHELACGLLRAPELPGVTFARPFYLATDRRRSASSIRRAFERHLLATVTA